MRRHDMNWARRMRRLLAWFATLKGAIVVVLLALAVTVGFVWQQLERQAERQADAAASRLAAVVARDVGRNVEQLDLMMQTALGGHPSLSSPGLSQRERNALLAERTPRDRYVDF